MSDPNPVGNVEPTDSSQVDGASAPAVPAAQGGVTGGEGESFSSFTTMGDLQRESPKLYRAILEAIFMSVKRMQDRVMKRVKALNRESRR